MKLFILLILGLGIVIGYVLARKRSGRAESEQSKQKMEGKNKIMDLFASSREVGGEVQNRDVEKLLGVSDSTAERYLNELEKEGKIVQHGQIGHSVFYTLK